MSHIKDLQAKKDGKDLVYSIAEKLHSGAQSGGEDEKKGKSWINIVLGAITFGLVMYFMSMMRSGKSSGGKGLFGNKLGGR